MVREPDRRKSHHGKLSQAIQDEVCRIGKIHSGHLLPISSDFLLRRMKLSPEKLKVARASEAHMCRLFQAAYELTHDGHITAKMARVIVQRALEELPAYTERLKPELTKEQVSMQEKIAEALETIDANLKGLPDEQAVKLNIEWIRNARTIQQDVTRQILGAKEYSKYINRLAKITAATNNMYP